MKFCLPFSAGIPVNVKNSFLFQLSLAVLATLLHALAFPNPLLANGLWPAGFIAYLPLFMLVRTAHWRYCAVTGAAYGFLSTVFFNYWLAGFHPLALPLAASIKLVYNAFFFIALRYAARIFPRYAAVLQTLFWVVFEYLQSLGFLGYTYGFAGYTQWRNIPLLQTASLTGVWGVSALVVFPQAWLAGAWAGTPSAIFKPRIPIALYAAILVFCLCRGAFFIPESGEERGDAPVRRIALIQQNDNPWKDSPDAYRQTLVSLIKLSNEALAGEQTENKNERNLSAPALVVWPETAFVPMFYWHIRYRTDHAYYTLVKELSDYLKKQDAFFLIGNDDGRREERDGALVRVDYNAALFFDGGELAGVYRKQRLVPFAEHFPYKKQLPFLHAMLVKAGFNFWEAGTENVIFDADGFRFAALICFEDGFGYLSRGLTRRGAQVLVNMTNDSWGNSLPCQMQHLAMSVFRAVENSRPVVRAACSGQTCAIDSNGRILAMAEPFKQTTLTVDVPLSTNETFYTRYGDWLPYLCLAAAFLMIIIRVTGLLTKKSR